MSNEIMIKLNEIIEKADLPDRHTYFQIEKFIIGKEPTAQAQLWAIVRELQSRKETIIQFEKDISDAQDNLELLDIKIERITRNIEALKANDNNCPENILNIKENEINIRKITREKKMLILSANKVSKKFRNILEEINCLLNAYDKIVNNHGDIKNIDDEQAQQEMWNEKLLEDFNLKMLLGRPLDPEFIKTVMCLNDNTPVKNSVVGLLKNVKSNIINKEKKGIE